MLLFLSLIAFIAWYGLAFLWGRFWDPLLDTPYADEPAAWPSIAIVVPARNEAEALPLALPSLLAQDYPGDWRIILVDDHSTDGTSDVARRLAAEAKKEDKLHIVQAPDLPPGWTGKVAAMQAGVAQAFFADKEKWDARLRGHDAILLEHNLTKETHHSREGGSPISGDTTIEKKPDYYLFTDADIRHPPSSLRRLVARAEADGLGLTSLMVKLNVASFAEKFMIPAFVFFFAMLYPFRKANDPSSKIAAAAGGVMLVRREALEKSGGLAAIKDALIDDCSLAKSLKRSGAKIRLTLTNDVLSLRPYPHLKDIHAMVARTAFTQLRHSALLLLGTVIGLGILFIVPVCASFTPDLSTAFLGLSAWIVMTSLYARTVQFYGLAGPWALSLPFAAIFYMVATVDSALRTWSGRGGQWKGRVQEQ